MVQEILAGNLGRECSLSTMTCKIGLGFMYQHLAGGKMCPIQCACNVIRLQVFKTLGNRPLEGFNSSSQNGGRCREIKQSKDIVMGMTCMIRMIACNGSKHFANMDDHVLGPSLGNADSKDTVMHYWQNAGFPKL